MAGQTPSNAGDKAAIDARDELCECTGKCTCLDDYRVSFEEHRPKLLELSRTLWPYAEAELTEISDALIDDSNLHYPIRLFTAGHNLIKDVVV